MRGGDVQLEHAPPARTKVEAPRDTPTPPTHGRQSRLRRRAEALLAHADIQIDGDRPWDIQVFDERLFRRAFTQGSLGLGEAYMDGWWEADALDQFFHRLLSARLNERFYNKWPVLRDHAMHRLVNLQRGRSAYKIGRHHYDLGNTLYRAMLDARMVYSCGYWKDADDLDAAQEAKLDLVCRKLRLEPGMRVLDIGCGWGSFVQFAAERYDVSCVGITVSREQQRLAHERVKGLPVEIRFQDYRALADERFDRVVSIGMFEHVGPKNHRAYMQAAHRVLADDGLHLLHTIGRPHDRIPADPWITKYIFPHSKLPSFPEIAFAADDLFVTLDVQDIGTYYDPTLMAWRRNFESAWEDIKQSGRGLDERFRRMWRYYLLSTAGAFRAGNLPVWQIVMSKGRCLPGGYDSVR